MSLLHITVETEVGYEDDAPSLYITCKARTTVPNLDDNDSYFEDPEELPHFIERDYDEDDHVMITQEILKYVYEPYNTEERIKAQLQDALCS